MKTAVHANLGNLLDIKLVLLTLEGCSEAREAVETQMVVAGFSLDTLEGAIATIEEMVQEAQQAEEAAFLAAKDPTQPVVAATPSIDAYALAAE